MDLLSLDGEERHVRVSARWNYLPEGAAPRTLCGSLPRQGDVESVADAKRNLSQVSCPVCRDVARRWSFTF